MTPYYLLTQKCRPRWPLLLLVICVSMGWARCAFSDHPIPSTIEKAHLIRIKGMINDAYTEAVKRKVAQAVEENTDLVILELDTPGGTVAASQELGDFILKSDVPIIAYINTKAYSGGTMVALACDAIFMDSAVGMMGDVAPITGGGEELGEKFQAPIRKTLRNYAEHNGYPVVLAESMVSKEMEVYGISLKDDPDTYQFVRRSQLETWPEEKLENIATQDLIVAEGELLAMSATEAVKYGFAIKGVSSRLDLFDYLGINDNQVTRLYLTGSERMLTFLDSISPLFIVGGLILLFIEINNPGFGIPGIAGLACIATFFLVKYSLNYAQLFEILLFCIGIALLLVEIFIIPGFGFVGGAGILLIFISMILMLQQFNWPSSPGEFDAFQFNIFQTLASFLGIAFGLLLIARMLGTLPVFKRLIRTETLASSTPESFDIGSQPAERFAEGDRGTSLTPLHPSGKASIKGIPVHVVSEGTFIPENTRVEITSIRGRRISVRPVEENETNE